MRRGNNESVGDGNYHYHYNREERLALSPRLREALECGEKRKRGFLSLVLRGNRGMVFLLVDVAILLVLFLIYSILMAGGDALWNKDGYSFRLSAHAHGDKVLVALRITRRSFRRCRPGGMKASTSGMCCLCPGRPGFRPWWSSGKRKKRCPRR